MSVSSTVLQDLENLIHPIKTAVETAVADVKAKAVAEETAISTDVKNAVANVVAAAKADAPEIEAAIKKGASDALAALEAALAAHGL